MTHPQAPVFTRGGGPARHPPAPARAENAPMHAAGPPAITLYDWAPSPFCIKVRAILDYKRLAYRRVSVLGRPILEVRRRGGVGKLPALEIEGRFVTDSTDIALALDARAPLPPLLPTSPRERALCLALEDWCDEALYFTGLHYQWIDPEGAALLPRAFGRSLFGQVALAFYRRLIRQQLRGQGTGRKPAAQIAGDLARQADAIEGLLRDGPFLMGTQPWLCDFALLGQMRYWTHPPATARVLQARPAIGAWLERMKALRTEPPQARAA
ncbi:MAG: glutathione S-transferase [Burkholderiales bacterium]|nr:glutathione S-transferase [Burkholderiales bacterium]